ncbi:DUF805 domain-containing protein [Helicobacter sp. MIT 05-5294]|uniref:DUF805 domain-containing protein n=1 Tax=Helicobacter sp. MIT 05-5294 TaxID=1548150 RepID=UPI000A4486F8|nr:DUF805 domain-containing protein [Helicobacter sp. MIT 05-5294]TLD86540.1 DUF805 domain-containing protein [Helicobacter sp. MIT 05-5294]
MNNLDSSRISRSKFWQYFIVYFVIKLFFLMAFKIAVSSGYDGVALLIPIFIAELFFIIFCVKRLHDINRSGWNCLWLLIPIIGWLIIIVWCGGTKGDVGENQYGTDPLQPSPPVMPKSKE